MTPDPLLHRNDFPARMLYFCATPGCSEAGRGFTDEPTFCSVCLSDLSGAYDTTRDAANRGGIP